MGGSKSIADRLRQDVINRAHSLCEYCRLPQEFCPVSFEIDHIIPRSQGGKTDAENLCLACPVCNHAKHVQTKARDPLTDRTVRLFHPRRQQWRRHFRWSQGFSQLEGRTAVGRATVLALNMNAERVVHLRQLWARMELFPRD